MQILSLTVKDIDELQHKISQKYQSYQPSRLEQKNKILPSIKNKSEIPRNRRNRMVSYSPLDKSIELKKQKIEEILKSNKTERSPPRLAPITKPYSTLEQNSPQNPEKEKNSKDVINYSLEKPAMKEQRVASQIKMSPQSYWDIVNIHKVTKEQEKDKQIWEQKNIQKAIFIDTLNSQVQFQENKRLKELNQRNYDFDHLSFELSQFKNELKARKREKKQTQQEIANMYLKQMQEKNKRDIQMAYDIRDSKDKSLDLQDVNTRNYRFREQFKKVQSENLKIHNQGLLNQQMQKQQDLQQQQEYLNGNLKFIDQNQLQHKRKIENSIDRIDKINQNAINSSLKIHSQAVNDRRNSIDQLAEQNAKRAQQTLMIQEEYNRLKRLKQLENYKDDRQNEIKQRDESMKQAYQIDLNMEQKLLQEDKDAKMKEKKEQLKKKKEKQALYKNELIRSGALEGGKKGGEESLEDREFLLNKSIIKDYIHVN